MTTPAQIIRLCLADLHDSPTNPRTHYDEASLAELAEDIKATGDVLQPICVRPRIPELFRQLADAADTAACGYEVVFGHRRKRAAELAGLTHISAMVSSMTDREVKLAQISENLQRKDVHPIEEAQGYQALIDTENETADRLAERFGKSRTYIYSRLKLLDAVPDVRQACLKGEVSPEVALLISRMPTAKMQKRALARIDAKHWDIKDGGARSYRNIRELLRDEFTCKLKDAPFPVEDEMLLPMVGHCLRCPKLSGNAPEFADVVHDKDRNTWDRHNIGPDICTDLDCFQAKKVAHFKREAEALKKQPGVVEVIDGNRARQLVSATGELKGGYVALKEVRGDMADARKAAQQGKLIAPPAVVHIQDPRSGKVFQAVKAADLPAAAAEPKQTKPYTNDWYAEQSAKADQRKAQRVALQGVIRQAAAQRERSVGELRLIVEMLLCNSFGAYMELLTSLWNPDDLHVDWESAVADLDGAQLALLLIDLVTAREAAHGHDDPVTLNAFAQLYGIDPTADHTAAGTPTPSTAARSGEGCEADAVQTPVQNTAQTPSTAGAAGGAAAPEGSAASQDQMDDTGCAGEEAGSAVLTRSDNTALRAVSTAEA